MIGSLPWLQRWLAPVLVLGIALGIASPLLIYRAIRVNSAVLIGLQERLADQLQESTGIQQAVLETLEQVSHQHARHLDLLTRLTDLEQRMQGMAERQTLALHHLIRTAEIGVYLASLPEAQRPTLPPPATFTQWLRETQVDEP